MGMLVMGIAINRAIMHKVFETTNAKVVSISVKQVSTKTINSNLQDQPDITFVSRCSRLRQAREDKR